MTAEFNSRVGGRAVGHEVEEPQRDERDERDGSEALWAFAITQTLVREAPRVHLSPPEPAPSAGARRATNDVDAAQRDPVFGADASGEAGSGSGSGGAAPPARIATELVDGKLGRIELSIAREEAGLDIVINVADARVKALIQAEHGQLLESLQSSGLRVASVQIGSPAAAGTPLALNSNGAREGARGSLSLHRPGSRWQAYRGPQEDDDTDTDAERVDLTA